MSKFKMTVSIPVQPHVKQYLEQNVFFKGKEFVLTSTSVIGSHLMKLIEPKSKGWLPLRYNPENIVTVQLTANNNFIVRPYISKSNAHQFNLFVERKIKEEMYVFIDTIVEYGDMFINDAITEYQNKYSIKDENMTFDSLKQSYFRYRRALENRDDKAA